jgi:penicillin-binding protein 1C
VERNQEIGLRNAAALLLDARTMQVKALVGSAGFSDASIEGQVNGVLAKRSPGSTLSPSSTRSPWTRACCTP